MKIINKIIRELHKSGMFQMYKAKKAEVENDIYNRIKKSKHKRGKR